MSPGSTGELHLPGAPCCNGGVRKAGLLLLVFAVSGVFLPVVLCVDACPEDEGGEECPPVCALCASCPRVSGAVVTAGPDVAPVLIVDTCIEAASSGIADAPPRDILHVPLAA